MTATPFINRPMKLAELLDRAIRLYRQNFFKFIGIIAIPYIPLTLIQMGLSVFSSTSLINNVSASPNSSDPFTFFTPSVLLSSGVSIFIAFVQFILVQGVASAALTRAVADDYTGKPVDILGSYKNLQNSWRRLVLALLAIFLIIIIFFIWMIIPCVGWFTGPGILMFMSLIVSPLVAPVVVLEKGGVVVSIRRAWDLARSRFWWLVGYAFVINLFGKLIVSGPSILFSVLIRTVLTLIPLDVQLMLILTTVLQSLVTLATSLLYLPLQMVITTVIYFDLRARTEGLDLALQLSSPADMPADQIELPEITERSTMPLITWLDVGRLALVSVAILTFYVIIFGAILMLGLWALPG